MLGRQRCSWPWLLPDITGSPRPWVDQPGSAVRASTAAQLTTTARAVGMPKATRYTLLNVWTNQTSTTSDKITANVPSNAVVIYRVKAG
jgi:Alpha galactosidase C-terminal beta sandwich domain